MAISISGSLVMMSEMVTVPPRIFATALHGDDEKKKRKKKTFGGDALSCPSLGYHDPGGCCAGGCCAGRCCCSFLFLQGSLCFSYPHHYIQIIIIIQIFNLQQQQHNLLVDPSQKHIACSSASSVCVGPAITL